MVNTNEKATMETLPFSFRSPVWERYSFSVMTQSSSSVTNTVFTFFQGAWSSLMSPVDSVNICVIILIIAIVKLYLYSTFGA